LYYLGRFKNPGLIDLLIVDVKPYKNAQQIEEVEFVLTCMQAEMEKCRASNAELSAHASRLERDLETMTRMYEAEVRGRRTDTAALTTLHSRATSATDSSAPPTAAAAPASPPPSPSVIPIAIVFN